MRRLTHFAMRDLVGALLGAGAAIVTVMLLDRANVERQAVTIGLLTAGAIGTALNLGVMRAVSAGVAAASVGQLVTRWFAQLDARIAGARKPAGPALVAI